MHAGVAHVRRLCKLTSIEQKGATVMHGSTAAIAINNAGAATARSRCIEFKWPFVRQLREQGRIRVVKVHIDGDVADRSTKALTAPKRTEFKDMMVSENIVGATRMHKVAQALCRVHYNLNARGSTLLLVKATMSRLRMLQRTQVLNTDF